MSAPNHDAEANNSGPLRIAVAVVELDGRFLVGRRPEGVPLAGLWEFPGGKVEPGETAAQAAARECLEETGVAIEVGVPYDMVDHSYEHATVRLTFFACKPLPPPCEPRPPFQWLPVTALTELAFPAANAALVARLIAGASGASNLASAGPAQNDERAGTPA